MLIDAHLHILEKDGFVADMIGQMDRLSVEKGLVLALPSEWVFLGAHCGGNDVVLQAVRQHADRLIGAVYLDLRRPDAVDTLKRYADAGFRAVKLHPTEGYYVDQPQFNPIYEEIQKIKLPIVVHCGLTNIPHTDPRQTTHSKYADPLTLDGVLRLFPGINWIIAHMGWPFYDVVWGLVQYNDNVYMDLSGPQAPINGLDRIQREGFGYTCGVDLFERMIWGSDGIDTELYLNMARDKLSQLTDPATVRRIFGGNIAHLLGLEDSS